MTNSLPTRRQMTAMTAGLAMSGLLRQRIYAADAKYRAAVIGHTGRGNYGHGLDVVWNSFPGCEIVAVADADEPGVRRPCEDAERETAHRRGSQGSRNSRIYVGFETTLQNRKTDETPKEFIGFRKVVSIISVPTPLAAGRPGPDKAWR